MMTHRYIQYIQSKTELSRQEACWLLQHVTEQYRPHEHHATELPEQVIEKLDEYIDQIARQHKPLAYVIGWVPFLDLKIQVRPPVLIPRPETEEWVNQLIERIEPKSSQIKRILDVGTGSGVIALALAKKLPQAQIIAVDVNPVALKLAQENALLNEITNVEWVQSDLLSALDQHDRFDLIVSNPPYIPEQELAELSPSVALWEDHNALVAKHDGMAIIEKIIAQSQRFIRINHDLPCQLVIEIDRTQREIVARTAEAYGWDCAVQQDIFKNWRTAWCSIKKND